MRYVVDANIGLFGLISDSMTRRLLVELENDLLPPTDVHDEFEKHQEMVFEKSGLPPTEVEDLIEILFKRIDVVFLGRGPQLALGGRADYAGYRPR